MTPAQHREHLERVTLQHQATEIACTCGAFDRLPRYQGILSRIHPDDITATISLDRATWSQLKPALRYRRVRGKP